MTTWIFGNRFQYARVLLCCVLLFVLMALSGLEHLEDSESKQQAQFHAIKTRTPQPITLAYAYIKEKTGHEPDQYFTVLIDHNHFTVPASQVPEWTTDRFVSLRGQFLPDGTLQVKQSRLHKRRNWKYLVSIPGILIWLFFVYQWIGWDPDTFRFTVNNA